MLVLVIIKKLIFNSSNEFNLKIQKQFYKTQFLQICKTKYVSFLIILLVLISLIIINTY